MCLLIIMNGFTATGKSYVAQKIADRIPNTKVFHSAAVRKEMNLQPDKSNKSLGAYNFILSDSVFVDVVSPVVYNEMLERAKKEISVGDNAILDGTFSFRKQRTAVYDFALAESVPICILQVVCEDENEIRRRLDKRNLSSNNTFDEADSWHSYQSTVDLAEPVEEDILPNGERPSILKYDTYSGELDASLLSKSLKSNGVINQIIKILNDVN